MNSKLIKFIMDNAETKIWQNESSQSSEPEKRDKPQKEPYQAEQWEPARRGRDSKGSPNLKPRNKSRVAMPSLTAPFVTLSEFISHQREDLGEKVIQKYYKVYVKEYYEQFFEEIFSEEKNSAWFKDLYAPSRQNEIYGALQELTRKKYREFNDNLSEHEHLRAINLEIDLASLKGLESKTDKLGNKVYELPNDQLSVLPTYIVPLINNYDYFLIPNVEKTTSFTDLHDIFKNDPRFENLHFNYPKRLKNFDRDFILTWREKASGDSIRLALSNAGISKPVTALQLRSRKIFVKTFESRAETSFHFFNISKVASALCSSFGINFSDFLNKIEELEKIAQFNLTVLLLFKVFNFNYFSANMYWNDLHLTQKEGIIILHSGFDLSPDFDPASEPKDDELLEQETYCTWKTQIEETLAGLKILEQPNLIEESYEKKLKKEFTNCHEGIWACDLCEKLFETQEFLIKHAKQKHIHRCDKVKAKIEEELELSNLFADKFGGLLVSFDSVFLKYSLGKRKDGPSSETNGQYRTIETKSNNKRNYITDYLNL